MKRRAVIAAFFTLATARLTVADSTITVLLPESHPQEAFEVRSAGRSPARPELIHRPGSPFQLRSGHRIWLEGDSLISPFAYSRVDLAEAAVITMPVVGAGTVTLPDSLHSDRLRAVWLLSLRSGIEDGTLRHELSRFRQVGEGGGGVQMPEGLVVAGLWDLRSRRFVAFSKVFRILASQIVEAPLTPPRADRSSVVVQLERSSPARDATQLGESSTALLTAAGELRAPDSMLSARDRIYGFWQDLDSLRVRLVASSGADLLKPIELDLRPGRIEWMEGVLDPRPRLDVELVLPESLRKEGNQLEVRSLPGAAVLAQAELPPDAWRHEFSGLAPGLVRVDLRTRLGVFTEEVELEVAASAYVRLEPEVILVSGTVFFGDEPRPSELLFMTVDKETTEILTDEQGAYQLASLAALRYVAVEPRGVEMAAWTDFFIPALTQSTKLDIHVPDTRIRAYVFDIETDESVAGAQVTFRNTFEAGGDGGERTIMQMATTDEEGVALLPPLKPGSVAIQASAPGYFNMREPLRWQVEKDDRTFEIGLEPTGPTVAVHLSLPGGAPARGAELLLVDAWATAQPIFSDTADENGVARVSRGTRGHLLVRHSEAAFLVRDWQPTEATEEVRWVLPATAPQPLALAIKDPQGQAASRAWLALWVDGRRLSGLILAWLTDSRPFADNNGFWTGSNLPLSPLGVVACPISHRNQGRAGEYDALATEIRPPWPPLLEIITVGS